MSKVTISYSSLKSASSEANQVAKKMTRYANNLNSAVYKKLSNYNGSYTSNISTAKSKTNSKISELKAKSKAYSKYADDLTALKDECLSTDKSVRSKVSQLTASFKEANGIKNSKVKNAINYCLTSFGNSTVAGRWVGNTSDKVTSVKDHITQSLKDWWNYDGGKQLVKGVVEGILEVAIGVITIITAIGSGAALIVILAAVVAAGIAVANGVMNIVNEGRAYNETSKNANPALGRRRSNQNTIQDTLRRESDSSLLHIAAKGIDVVNLACTVVSVVNSAGKLIKNGYKWASGCTSGVKDLRVKNLLSKDNWSNFFNKTKTNIGNGFTEIGQSIKGGDFSFIKIGLKNFGTDFATNLKNNFFNFKDSKSGLKSTSKLLGVAKDFISDGFDAKNIVEDIIFPGITLAEFTTIKTGDGGQMYFDFSDKILLSDVYSIGDKIGNNIIGSDVFSSDFIINSDTLNTLSSSCNIDISIPEINIPPIEMPALRAG